MNGAISKVPAVEVPACDAYAYWVRTLSEHVNGHRRLAIAILCRDSALSRHAEPAPTMSPNYDALRSFASSCTLDLQTLHFENPRDNHLLELVKADPLPSRMT